MPNPITTIRDYLKSSVAELRKVTWPSRDMTIRYSLLVIVASTALAVFFAALDFGLSRAVTIALERRSAPALETPVTPDVTPTVEGTPEPVNIQAEPAEPAPSAAEGTPAPVTPTDGGLQLPPLETPKP